MKLLVKVIALCNHLAKRETERESEREREREREREGGRERAGCFILIVFLVSCGC